MLRLVFSNEVGKARNQNGWPERYYLFTNRKFPNQYSRWRKYIGKQDERTVLLVFSANVVRKLMCLQPVLIDWLTQNI